MEPRFLLVKKGFNMVLDKIKIISVKNGSLKAEFKVTEDYVNEYDNLHDGFSATAIDVLTAIGLQSTSEKKLTYVSLDLHLSFLEPTRLGDEILIETKTFKKGRTLCFLEAEMRNKLTNNLLLKGEQIVYLMNK